MKSRHNLMIAAGILILAISGNAIWLSEIIYRFTWASLGWLYSTLYSPYLLVAFPAIAFLLPFVLQQRIGFKRILIAFILLYFTNLSFYRFGDNLLRLSFSKLGMLALLMYNSISPIILVYLFHVLILCMFGIIYFLIIKYQITRIKWWWALLFDIGIIVILPLSWLTYKVLPVTEDTEWFYNAIKAGYPVFWTIIVMGSAGWIIEKRTRETLESNTP